jgi:hypothetical protein
MSSRERWTVYPLLFLTLGIALKDKLTKQVNTKQVNTENIICKQLFVTDSQAHPQVVMRSTGDGGTIAIAGDNRRPNIVLGQSSVLWGLSFTDAFNNTLPRSLGYPTRWPRPMMVNPPPQNPAAEPEQPETTPQPAEAGAPEEQPSPEQSPQEASAAPSESGEEK